MASKAKQNTTAAKNTSATKASPTAAKSTVTKKAGSAEGTPVKAMHLEAANSGRR